MGHLFLMERGFEDSPNRERAAEGPCRDPEEVETQWPRPGRRAWGTPGFSRRGSGGSHPGGRGVGRQLKIRVT